MKQGFDENTEAERVYLSLFRHLDEYHFNFPSQIDDDAVREQNAQFHFIIRLQSNTTSTNNRLAAARSHGNRR